MNLLQTRTNHICLYHFSGLGSFCFLSILTPITSNDQAPLYRITQETLKNCSILSKNNMDDYIRNIGCLFLAINMLRLKEMGQILAGFAKVISKDFLYCAICRLKWSVILLHESFSSLSETEEKESSITDTGKTESMPFKWGLHSA